MQNCANCTPPESRGSPAGAPIAEGDALCGKCLITSLNGETVKNALAEIRGDVDLATITAIARQGAMFAA